MTDVHPLICDHRLVVVPGVYDVLSATLAARAGFHAAVLTGYGFAAAHLGEPGRRGGRRSVGAVLATSPQPPPQGGDGAPPSKLTEQANFRNSGTGGILIPVPDGG